MRPQKLLKLQPQIIVVDAPSNHGIQEIVKEENADFIAEPK